VVVKKVFSCPYSLFKDLLFIREELFPLPFTPH